MHAVILIYMLNSKCLYYNPPINSRLDEIEEHGLILAIQAAHKARKTALFQAQRQADRNSHSSGGNSSGSGRSLSESRGISGSLESGMASLAAGQVRERDKSEHSKQIWHTYMHLYYCLLVTLQGHISGLHHRAGAKDGGFGSADSESGDEEDRMSRPSTRISGHLFLYGT